MKKVLLMVAGCLALGLGMLGIFLATGKWKTAPGHESLAGEILQYNPMPV
ncbi:hypothetical protein [Endozoicomonas sp. ONNA2]|nr:hypothetical protein [Endozoicomonas sp. ONNA2]